MRKKLLYVGFIGEATIPSLGALMRLLAIATR